MESEEFMELPVNQLMDIISSDELNVRSEEQVFSAVMAWVKYNVTERRPYLAQVSYVIVWLGFFAVCIYLLFLFLNYECIEWFEKELHVRFAWR